MAKKAQQVPYIQIFIIFNHILALNFCLPLVTRSDDMIPLLSGEAVRLTRNSLVSKERFLFKQGQEFVAILAQKVAKSDTELQRVIFATLIHFTPLTKSMCVAIIKVNIKCKKIIKNSYNKIIFWRIFCVLCEKNSVLKKLELSKNLTSNDVFSLYLKCIYHA